MKNNHKLATRFLALEKAIISLEKVLKAPMDEDLADKIYKNIIEYTPVLRTSFEKLEKLILKS